MFIRDLCLIVTETFCPGFETFNVLALGHNELWRLLATNSLSLISQVLWSAAAKTVVVSSRKSSI